MLHVASKAFFHLLAQNGVLKKLASRYGMRHPSSFARRFIAGETVEEAIEAARAIQSRGMTITLDLLGESVTDLARADAATQAYIAVLHAVAASGIERNISLKLTQLGLDVDKACAVDNLRKILERAEPAGFFVRIDMEGSAYTDLTLEIFETLWQQGSRRIGVVLQSSLMRSERDLARMNALGARVRLVKGAYQEPKTIAYADKADVDAAYARMLKTLLVEGHYPAIATHDESMIDLARRHAREHGIAADRFEFQMLYGIRRDLQARLAQEGYRVRMYVPFGREWFPYFMRRLGERPANVGFVIRGLVGER
ncbi:MAG TPA: proline dehydrogenase family protein [Vicinamibacterales bacterium]|nr:proline dehydrogenase family protein [Vicinamibacterales bacterium]